MAISGIGVQIISAKSGIGPQLPPPPESSNDNRREEANTPAPTQAAPAPGTGQVIDLTI